MELKRSALLIALGGNALSPQGGTGSVPEQYRQALITMAEIVEVIERGVGKLVVSHGNGPQVGSILLRSEMASRYVYPLPLDSCVAASQGGIGYTLQLALQNRLRERNLHRPAATLVTEVIVDPDDPAFQNPTKPIGKFYAREDAMMLQRERGWVMKEDAKRGWRQVVPSPTPLDFVETEAIEVLVSAGVIVIAGGGGGIPVVREGPDGHLEGVAAVVDKDRASALLAHKLGFDTLCILTAVSHVALDYATPRQRPIERTTVAELKRFRQAGEFAEGSMLPKIDAVIDFLEHGGKRAIITAPGHLLEALDGETGTIVLP